MEFRHDNVLDVKRPAANEDRDVVEFSSLLSIVNLVLFGEAFVEVMEERVGTVELDALWVLPVILVTDTKRNVSITSKDE